MDWKTKFNHIKQMSMHIPIIDKSHDLCFSSAIWTYQFQIKKIRHFIKANQKIIVKLEELNCRLEKLGIN